MEPDGFNGARTTFDCAIRRPALFLSENLPIPMEHPNRTNALFSRLVHLHPITRSLPGKFFWEVGIFLS